MAMTEPSFEPTPVSLLRKLQQRSTTTVDAWGRFVQLYTPLLYMWARRLGADEHEAPDLVQDVFVILAAEMPAFRLDPSQRFRGWLWTVLLNKWRDRARRRAAGPPLADADMLQTLAAPDNVAGFTEEEYRNYLFNRALELMQAELPSDEWLAWHGYIIQGRPAAEVADELGQTVNQVYLAKSRILRRLRVELAGLLD
jgi:RNA polymerase sigma-70 factor (ECF subfamily)